MNDELQALRRVAQVLARVTTPIERQNIARRVAQKTKGDDSELALSLSHAAALFWPGDPGKTAQVLENITQAFDAGELGGFIPKEHRHIIFTELTVWPDCPAMAVDSPLRYWVPDAPAQPQDEAETLTQSAPAAPDGQAWTLRQPQRFRGYTAPEAKQAEPQTAPVVGENAEQRQARRWQLCIDKGLTMPTDTYAQLPRGIKQIAKAENITRQALAQDLNAYRERLFGK